jgi:AcrR family transcriptional regulator
MKKHQPPRRDASQAITRQQLLDSARLAFIRNGYAGTTIDAIAEGAGFSKGAFYSNFQSKEGILFELLEEHQRRERAELQEILDRSESSEGLFMLLDPWLENLNQSTDWALLVIEMRLLAQRSPGFASAYLDLERGHRKVLGQFIQEAFRRSGKVLPLDPDILASACVALAEGMALQRFNLNRQPQTPDPSGRVIMLFMKGLISP